MIDINKAVLDENFLKSDPHDHLAELDEWSPEKARELAVQEGIELTDDHWQVIYMLRGHFRAYGRAHSGTMLLRTLEAEFAEDGGGKFLFRLFPKGPVSQASRLAGLPLPPYASDPSFGSVQ